MTSADHSYARNDRSNINYVLQYAIGMADVGLSKIRPHKEQRQINPEWVSQLRKLIMEQPNTRQSRPLYLICDQDVTPEFAEKAKAYNDDIEAQFLAPMDYSFQVVCGQHRLEANKSIIREERGDEWADEDLRDHPLGTWPSIILRKEFLEDDRLVDFMLSDNIDDERYHLQPHQVIHAILSHHYPPHLHGERNSKAVNNQFKLLDKGGEHVKAVMEDPELAVALRDFFGLREVECNTTTMHTIAPRVSMYWLYTMHLRDAFQQREKLASMIGERPSSFSISEAIRGYVYNPKEDITLQSLQRLGWNNVHSDISTSYSSFSHLWNEIITRENPRPSWAGTKNLLPDTMITKIGKDTIVDKHIVEMDRKCCINHIFLLDSTPASSGKGRRHRKSWLETFGEYLMLSNRSSPADLLIPRLLSLDVGIQSFDSFTFWSSQGSQIEKKRQFTRQVLSNVGWRAHWDWLSQNFKMSTLSSTLVREMDEELASRARREMEERNSRRQAKEMAAEAQRRRMEEERQRRDRMAGEKEEENRRRDRLAAEQKERERMEREQRKGEQREREASQNKDGTDEQGNMDEEERQVRENLDRDSNQSSGEDGRPHDRSSVATQTAPGRAAGTPRTKSKTSKRPREPQEEEEEDGNKRARRDLASVPPPQPTDPSDAALPLTDARSPSHATDEHHADPTAEPPRRLNDSRSNLQTGTPSSQPTGASQTLQRAPKQKTKEDEVELEDVLIELEATLRKLDEVPPPDPARVLPTSISILCPPWVAEFLNVQAEHLSVALEEGGPPHSLAFIRAMYEGALTMLEGAQTMVSRLPRPAE